MTEPESKPERNTIFTLTVLSSLVNKRVVGWFSCEFFAERCIKDRPVEIRSGDYTYLVVEQIESGSLRLSKVLKWYKWLASQEKWIPVTPPDWARYYVNFAIG